MSKKAIGDLTPATSIGVNDLLVMEQNNEAKKVPGQLLKDMLNRNIVSYDGEIVASDAAGGAEAAEEGSGYHLHLKLPHGAGIKRVDAPENPCQPGAIDTYTLISEDVRLTDELIEGSAVGTFRVYNGMNGTGTVNTVANVPPNASTHDVPKAALINALADDIFDMIWPVGSIYTSKTASVNPGDTTDGIFKRGTWVQITDRFILAAGTRDAGDQDGHETHQLTRAELPNVNIPIGDVPRNYTNPTALSYSFAMFRTNASSGSNWYFPARDDNSDSSATRVVTEPLGSGDAIDIMPPYEVAYVWERTA